MAEAKTTTLNALLHDKVWSCYQRKSNIVNAIAEDDDFFNDRQWGDYDPSDNLPRITMNIIRKGVTQIASKINGTPLYLSYSAFSKGDGGGYDCSKLTRFDDFVLSQLDDVTFGWQSCVNSGVRGTEITYVRWDKDDETIKAIYDGGLAYEHIDPRSFAVANPYLQDIQKQEWVMFWSDVPIRAIKGMIDAEDLSDDEKAARKKALERDDAPKTDDVIKDKSLINDAMLRVYTRFFRINGEVCYMCSTQSVDIFAYPKTLSTLVPKDYAKKAQEDYERRLRDMGSWASDGDFDFKLTADLDIDYEDVAIGDYDRSAVDDREYAMRRERFSEYPFAVYRASPRTDSFFGYSMTKAMIPSQKALNFCYSMVVQCAQNNAFSKIFVKDGALGNQTITNEPGQIIYDYSDNPASWGIKLAESQPMPNDLTTFAQAFMSDVSKTYGFADIMSGEVTNQDLSGYAVAQMVKQANTPIEQQQQLFWKYKKDLAKIRIAFYKHYIDEAYFSWDYTDSEMEEQEFYRDVIVGGIRSGLTLRHEDGTPFTDEEKESIAKDKVKKTHFDSIKGSELWGNEVVIQIDAQQGLADSKLTEEQAFDNLIINGGIANLDADTFDFIIKCDPAFSPKTKSAMMTYSRIKRNGEIAQLKAQIAQLEQQLQAASSQLGYQASYNKSLQAEFSEKINAANRYTKGLREENSMLAQKAQSAISEQSARNSRNGASIGDKREAGPTAQSASNQG